MRGLEQEQGEEEEEEEGTCEFSTLDRRVAENRVAEPNRRVLQLSKQRSGPGLRTRVPDRRLRSPTASPCLRAVAKPFRRTSSGLLRRWFPHLRPAHFVWFLCPFELVKVC